MHISNKLQNQFKAIKLVIFDVDGVLTDGKIYYASSGDEMKAFHAQDGAAIKMLMVTGVEVAIITGRESAMVSRRAQELGIKHVYQKTINKETALSQLLEALSLQPEQVAHAGDDLADLAIFKRVGLSISVPGAHPEVLSRAHFITNTAAGLGAAREICHTIMHSQGTWEEVLATFLA